MRSARPPESSSASVVLPISPSKQQQQQQQQQRRSAALAGPRGAKEAKGGSRNSQRPKTRARNAWLRIARINRGRGRNEAWMMDAIRGLYCLFDVSRVQNDGVVARLHVLTAVLLLTFSAMVSMKQAVGNPIDCVHTRDIPVEAFNAYCWIHSTYFVTGAMLGVAGVNVAFPGVGSTLFYQHRQRVSSSQPQQPPHRSSTDSVIRQVKYYQWVPFFLIFQMIYDTSSLLISYQIISDQHRPTFAAR